MKLKNERRTYTGELTELKLMFEKQLENQVKMQGDLHNIKLSLFEPDNGVYARINKNTAFRMTAAKWLWILTTGVVMIILKNILSVLVV